MLHNRYFVTACVIFCCSHLEAQPLWQVELRYDQQGINIENIVLIEGNGSVPTARAASPHANTQIQLTDSSGDTLFQTHIADPRLLRAPFSLDGQQGHVYALAQPDTLSILVPALPHAERLRVTAPLDPLQPLQNTERSIDTMSVRVLAASIPLTKASASD